MRISVTLVLSILLNTTFAQTKAPIWLFPSCDNTINGIAIGLAELKPECVTGVNGVRLELIGLGIGIGFAGFHPSEGDEFNQIRASSFVPSTINGINLSLTGTISSNHLNGLTVGGFGQIFNRINGVMISVINNSVSINGAQFSLLGNDCGIVKGIQLSLFNGAKELNGFQIGLLNKTSKIKGIQIGLWNKNDKRSLPLINW